MKKYIAGIATGVLLSCTVALAVNYTATENVFPVKLNGNDVSISGYNIDGSTYFKLRDIADVVGGFDVDFQNNTIQLAKDGYVYDNSQVIADNGVENALEQYAIKNLTSLYQEDLDVTYHDVKYKLADLSGDDIPELIAVGIQDNSLYYMEVYDYNDGNIKKIYSGHCQGYHGGSAFPVLYEGNYYICGSSYSSSTGFLKNLIRYNGKEWETVFYSRVQYNYESGTLEKYIVNDNSVSESDYDDFNNKIMNGSLSADDFIEVVSISPYRDMLPDFWRSQDKEKMLTISGSLSNVTLNYRDYTDTSNYYGVAISLKGYGELSNVNFSFITDNGDTLHFEYLPETDQLISDDGTIYDRMK